ncbi:MAG: hypothetical protein ACUVXA_11655 [Candidatus Jordarchaeum sp.]|uniref:hypothetical protein n=1 Tax=Candidatus Jordarchaeum sp. TaxID=2823881 RepID=UPI00404980B6
MEDELKTQIQEYLELCQRVTEELRKKYGFEIDSPDFIREHSEEQLELAEDVRIYIQRITEYLELRKRAFNDFLSHLFWLKQAQVSTNPDEISFYLSNAIEGLIDMETLLNRETELLINFEKNVQTIKNFLKTVGETKKEFEDYQKIYPELLSKLEQILVNIKKTASKTT